MGASQRRSAILVLAALASLAASCGAGNGASNAGTPQAAAERALLTAKKGDKLAFARMLASGPRGKATAEIQLEILSEWLYYRGLGALDLDGATLTGWDALRLDASSASTATVATVLRFERPADDPPQRPAPLEIDLVLENGSWRIADARMTPLPAWWTKQHEEPQPTFPGEEPAPLPRPPTLAQTAATYRMPPASFKR